MSPGQNVTQEVRAKRHPVGQGKMSQGNTSQGKTSPRAKRLRAVCHPTVVLCVFLRGKIDDFHARVDNIKAIGAALR